MPDATTPDTTTPDTTTPGTLILCATPIGNLGDLSDRAAKALSSAHVIFAEDTRRTGRLLEHVGASTPMRSFFAHNERSRLDELMQRLARGETVVLVSDAGTPVISDPGMSAVGAAVSVGAAVTAIPGPSAVVTSLAVSGFNGDRFVSEGFLPRRGRLRTAALAAIVAQERTTVFFAAPSRVVRDLEDLAGMVDSERRVVVARELTKLHEEVWRGTIQDAADHWGRVANIRGEISVIIEGAATPEPDLAEAHEAAQRLIDKGATPSGAVRQVAGASGVSRRELYDLVIKGRS